MWSRFTQAVPGLRHDRVDVDASVVVDAGVAVGPIVVVVVVNFVVVVGLWFSMRTGASRV